MNESICIGVDLVYSSRAQGRWNRLAAGVRRKEGGRTVGGMIVFDEVDRNEIEWWLIAQLEDEDTYELWLALRS